MQILQRTFFISISCFFLFASCTPKIFKEERTVPGNYSNEEVRIFREDTSESMVYKTTFDYKNKSFSALTYVKYTGNGNFSIILLTTFGNTLLEAQLSKDHFTVNNVVSYLNRKPLLNLLEKDWRLLLKGNFEPHPP